MSQQQSQGFGGLSYKSTNDLSGTASDVTNGNPVGTTFKNGVGLAVKADTANDVSVVLCSDAAQPAIGVLQDNPKAGQACRVQSARGTSAKVLTGAAVTRGDMLMSDAYGRAVKLTSGGHYLFAIAMESASAAGVLIEAVLADGYLA